MKISAILSFLALSMAVPVPYDMDVSWVINGDMVKFTFSISPETHSTFGWSGTGIKQIEDGANMKNGDYVSVVYSTGETIDRHGVRNGSPKPDEEQEGMQNLSDIAFLGYDENNYAQYTWSRSLNTGDAMDTVLEVGNQYYLQWAVGDHDASTNVIKHHKDSGSLTITFTEDSVQPTSFLSAS